MGLDPSSDDYEPGVQCVMCKDLLFGGTTPKWIQIDVSGIVACPGAPGVPPSGTWIMTQIDFCIWSSVDLVTVLGVNFNSNPDTVVIIDVGTAKWWFKSELGDVCGDSFGNRNVICGGFVIGTEGTVSLSWGPSIFI